MVRGGDSVRERQKAFLQKQGWNPNSNQAAGFFITPEFQSNYANSFLWEEVEPDLFLVAVIIEFG